MKKKEKSKKNLNFPIKNFKGEVYKGVESGSKLLAEMIASTDSKQDFFKIFNISKELYSNGDVKEGDEELLLSELKKLRLPVLVKGRIYKYLNS